MKRGKKTKITIEMLDLFHLFRRTSAKRARESWWRRTRASRRGLLALVRRVSRIWNIIVTHVGRSSANDIQRLLRDIQRDTIIAALLLQLLLLLCLFPPLHDVATFTLLLLSLLLRLLLIIIEPTLVMSSTMQLFRFIQQKRNRGKEKHSSLRATLNATLHSGSLRRFWQPATQKKKKK